MTASPASAHDEQPDAGHATAQPHATSPAPQSGGAPGSFYVTATYQPGVGSSTLSALNAADGSLRWQRDYGTVDAGAPVLAGGFLYQIQNGISCIRPSDGATVWHIALAGPIHSTPVLAMHGVNGVLYIQAANRVHALSTMDGAELWQTPPGYLLPPFQLATGKSAGTSFGHTSLQHVGNEIAVVQVRTSDGTPGWRFAVTPRSQEGDDSADCWAVGHGHVYVLNMSDYEDIALYALNLADGSVAWRYPALALELTQDWLVRPVAVDQESVYLLSNEGQGHHLTHLYALDPAGGSVRWRIGLAGATFASGTLFHGVLYLALAGTQELVAVEPGNGRLRWRQMLGPYLNTPALLSGGQLFVNSLHAGLFVLDVHSGALLWQYPVPQAVQALAAASGIVYLAVTFNAMNMPPGSHYLCALRESDRAMIWRHEVPAFFHGTLVGP